MITFTCTHFPKDLILYTVFFYVRYPVSYRDLEEIVAERGVHFNHATLISLGGEIQPADRASGTPAKA